MLASAWEWVGFALVALALLATCGYLGRRYPPWFSQLLMIGLVLRIAGAIARLEIARQVYRSGDYARYYFRGIDLAGEWWSLNLSGVAEVLGSGQWWGTRFLELVSGGVLFFIGPTLRGEFLVFAAFGYLGLVLLTLGFFRIAGTREKWVAYAVLLLPSLVYWPSSIGKESVVLLGLGVTFHGYAVGGSLRVLKMLLGIALLASIRPHIAMMIAVTLAIAEWVTPGRLLTSARLAQGAALAGLAVAVVLVGLSQFDIQDEYAGDLGAFIEERSARTVTGGSAIERPSGLAIVPVALVNVLFRPFLWEVRNPVVLLSAIEALVFWWLVFRNRSGLWAAIRMWRHSRLLRFSLPAAGALIVFYGGFISNLGILARQRVVVLPLLFFIIAVGRQTGRRKV